MSVPSPGTGPADSGRVRLALVIATVLLTATVPVAALAPGVAPADVVGATPGADTVDASRGTADAVGADAGAAEAVGADAGTVEAPGAPGETSVERTGDRLLVEVPASALGDDTRISLVVDGRTVGPFADSGTAGDTYSYSVPVEALAVEGAAMGSVTVAVVAGGETLTTVHGVDLRLFAFDGSREPRFEDGRLLLPVRTAAGFADSVPLSLDGGRTMAAPLAGDGWLVIDRVPLLVAEPALRDGRLDVAVQPPSVGDRDREENLGTRSFDVRGPAAARTTLTTTADGDALVLESPLLFEGLAYRVEATSESGDRFVGNVTAGERSLTVGGADLAGADSVTVDVRRGGEVVLETSGQPAGEARSDATTGGDGGDATAPDGRRDDAGFGVLAALPDESTLVGGIAALVLLLVAGIAAVLARARLRTRRRGRTAGGGRTGGGGGQTGGGSQTGADGGGDSSGFAAGGDAAADRQSAPDRPETGDHPTPAAGAGDAASTEHEVTVRLVEDSTGATLGVDGELLAEPGRGTGDDRRTVAIVDGTATIELPDGHWQLTARCDGVNVADRVDVSGITTVALGVSTDLVGLEVRDVETRDPVADAEVVCRPADGTEFVETTDQHGRVEVTVSPESMPVDVTVGHDRYAEATGRVGADGEAGAETVRLRPLTGGVRSTVTVGGRPTAGVPVEVVARDVYVKRNRQERYRATTDRRGRVEFDGLLAGTYEVRVAFPEDSRRFGRPSSMVEVADDTSTRANLDVEFRYSLSPKQMNRMAAVRERVEALTDASAGDESGTTAADEDEAGAAAADRDVVVPRYYGSVVTALLDVVERLPAEGHRFAGADVEPDALVDVLLAAAERATDAVSASMSTERNGRLFAACADLPDSRVRWEGSFDVAALFERLNADPDEQRGRLRDRLATVADRVAVERSDLVTMSPATATVGEVEERFLEAAATDDPAAVAAATFVADGLLDAVEGVLDREELRQRLERSVD